MVLSQIQEIQIITRRDLQAKAILKNAVKEVEARLEPPTSPTIGTYIRSWDVRAKGRVSSAAEETEDLLSQLPPFDFDTLES